MQSGICTIEKREGEERRGEKEKGREDIEKTEFLNFRSKLTFQHDCLVFGETDTCIIRGFLGIVLEINVAYLPEVA